MGIYWWSYLLFGVELIGEGLKFQTNLFPIMLILVYHFPKTTLLLITYSFGSSLM